MTSWGHGHENVFGLVLAGLIAFGAEANLATAHCSVDQGYYEENCAAGDAECYEREKAQYTSA